MLLTAGSRIESRLREIGDPGAAGGKSALVIGGNGFIGSNIANFLLHAGWRVRIFDRAPAGRAAGSTAGSGDAAEYIGGDLLDRAALHEALQDMDVVLYFASHSVPSNNPRFLADEIDGTLRSLDFLITAMLETGSAMLVFPSSGGTVYGECKQGFISEQEPASPLSSYGMGKLLCEELIRFYHRVHGLEYQILRIANVYGCHFPRTVNQGVIEIFLHKVMQGLPLEVWGSSENVRDYLFIDDLCRAVEQILAAAPAPGVFNVGTGEGHTVNDVIAAIETVTGKKAAVKFVPAPGGTLSLNVLDIGKICNTIGWKPSFSLLEGIKTLYERMLASKQENRFI